MNLPTWITTYRILLIPLLWIAFYSSFSWAHSFAVVVFLIAAWTDWLDGYLARHLSQKSNFGAFLDPVADKLLVISALILLTASSHSFAINLASAVLIGREVAVSALREWSAHAQIPIKIPVSYWGKVKTACQMLGIAILLYGAQKPQSVLFYTGCMFLYLAVILAGVSFMRYWKSILHRC